MTATAAAMTKEPHKGPKRTTPTRTAKELRARAGRMLYDLLGGRPPSRAYSSKLVSYSEGCIFVGVPKVATTSLLRHFQILGLLVDGTVESAPLPEVLKRHPAAREFVRFGFVRNPWGRLLSCYRDKIEGGGRDAAFKLSTYHGLDPRMSFADFVRWVHASPDGQDARADRHWMSQHRFFDAGDGSVMDFIGRFERLDRDLAQISTRLGLPAKRLTERLNVSGGRDYRPHYTDETAALVAERYAVDIRAFGYAF